MGKIIKTYEAKSGEVTITQYGDGSRTEYLVKHSNDDLHFASTWFMRNQKTDAIAHAQFLARY